MNTLSKNELQALSGKQLEPCISIYLPTHRAGKEVEQDPIRFKNLLRQVEKDLSERGRRSLQINEWLEPAKQLLSDSFFWSHQSDGLAVFIAPKEFHHYRVPQKFDELAVISGRFHLKPLLPLLSGNARFYFLALSQNQARLFQGTRYSVSEVELKNVPKSLAEALQYDDPERQLQFHTRAPAAKGERAAMFHGHGAGHIDEAVHKKDILRYFQQLDKGVQDLLRNERAPLVLAGVDYLLPIYREANSYQHLLDEGVLGNPDELSTENLRERAWAVVQPHFQKAQQEAVAKYRQLANTGRAANELKDVVPAAYHGQVDFLFVNLGMQVWGTFEQNDGEIQIHQKAEPGDEDLLDSAAIQTFLNRGTVYAVAADEMPDKTPVAAVLRY